MTDSIRTLDIMQTLGPGWRQRPCQLQPNRYELSHELQRYLHVLGPTPKRCLETLADIGMTDLEIARYFKIPENVVADLRNVWNIGSDA